MKNDLLISPGSNETFSSSLQFLRRQKPVSSTLLIELHRTSCLPVFHCCAIEPVHSLLSGFEPVLHNLIFSRELGLNSEPCPKGKRTAALFIIITISHVMLSRIPRFALPRKIVEGGLSARASGKVSASFSAGVHFPKFTSAIASSACCPLRYASNDPAPCSPRACRPVIPLLIPRTTLGFTLSSFTR